MSSPLTHERCSELLADYLAEELDPEQRRLVEDHLEYCAQCSAERAGLSALSADTEGLTTDERAALRAAVLGASIEKEVERGLADESDAVVVPLGGRGERASKYLGIAALLAILAVGSLFVFRGGGLGITGGDDSSGSAVEVAEDSGGQAGGEDETLEDSAETETSSPFLNARDANLRYQSDRGAISEEDLSRLGRSAFSASANDLATSGAQSEESQSTRKEFESDRRALDRTLERLAAQAPSSLANDVTECGQTALDELDRPGLATYATTATLEGTDVIVIGFVTGDSTPDRYAVFAFPLGDCTTILTSTEGPLE